MSNSSNLSKLEVAPKNEFSEIDGFIKFILATLLAIIPFLLQKQMSLGILFVFLILITIVSKIKPRTLFLSAVSYCIIVLIPYFFGLLMNSLFYTFSHNAIFTMQESPYHIFLRLFRLFVIWYISILYFHTTPMKTVIGLLDKFLTPLKLIGVPIKDYLKVVMCIVIELKETGSDVTKSLSESMRSAVGGAKNKFRLNIKGISQIIVSLIVNSFEKIDKIQSFVEKVKPEDLYHYSFKLSKNEILAVLSFIVITSMIFLIEKGYWL